MKLVANDNVDWVPVSDGLPENSGECLVSVVNTFFGTEYVKVAWYITTPTDCCWRDVAPDERVIAWTCIPAVYRPQGRNYKD